MALTVRGMTREREREIKKERERPANLHLHQTLRAVMLPLSDEGKHHHTRFQSGRNLRLVPVSAVRLTEHELGGHIHTHTEEVRQ